MNRLMSNKHRMLFLKAAVICFSLVFVPGFVLLKWVSDSQHPSKGDSQTDVTGDTVAEAAPGPGLNAAFQNRPKIESPVPDSASLKTENPLSSTAVAEGPSGNSHGSVSPSKSADPDHASARIHSDPRLHAFQLSAKTWAVAFDEMSGRLAVTHDDCGVLVYDIGKIPDGPLVPVGILPTRGLPLAVCLKALSDRRVFVVSGQNSPLVELYDADTLDRIGGVQLPEAKYADVLACSQSSNDPYVYFSTDDSTQMEDRDRVGRVNIATQTYDSQTDGSRVDDREIHIKDIYVSPDGTQLCGFLSDGQSFAATYTGQGGVGHLTNMVRRGDSNGGLQMAMHPRHALACVGYYFLEPDLSYALGIVTPISSQKSGEIPQTAPFPLAFFSDLPLCLALDPKASFVSLASTNSFRSLAEFPLPGDWKENEFSPKATRDIRWRRKTAHGLTSFFLWAQADNVRKRAILITNDYAVIVPVDDKEIPPETLLTMTSPLPDTVSIRKTNTIELSCGIEGATFAFVPGWESTFRQYNSDRILFDEAPKRPRHQHLRLIAPVDSDQTAVLMESIESVKGRPLPFRIRIDNEILTVTKADDLTDSLTVERAGGLPHSVTAPIEIIEGSTAQSSSDVPYVQGNTLIWTPSEAQLGDQLAILRISHGGTSREVCWRVKVRQSTMTVQPLPFVVNGIQCYSESLAIVWGGQATSGNDRREDTIGVIDSGDGKLIRSVKLKSEVLSVATNGDAIYAAIKDLPEKPGFSQILVLDSDTLKTVRTIEVSSGCMSLSVVGGKYLIGTDGRGNPETQLSLPDFKSLPAEERTADPLMGRVGDGWSWNGAIWDSGMKKARLLMLPRLEPESLLEAMAMMTDPLGGQIERTVNGPFMYNWIPTQRFGGPKLRQANTTILDYPGGFRISGQELVFDSWAKSWAERAGSPSVIPPKKTVSLAGSGILPNELSPHKVEVCADNVLVAAGNGIMSFPLTDFLPKEEEPWFRFVEEQDAISLNISRPSKISYSARGAADYQLRLFLTLSPFGDSQPLYSLKSKNGSFTLSWDPADEIINAARYVCGLEFAGSNDTEKVEETIKKYTLEYNLLTGKALSGVPVPIYASVNAVHEDGKQKAGMLHCYILEVPKAMLLR